MKIVTIRLRTDRGYINNVGRYSPEEWRTKIHRYFVKLYKIRVEITFFVWMLGRDDIFYTRNKWRERSQSEWKELDRFPVESS